MPTDYTPEPHRAAEFRTPSVAGAKFFAREAVLKMMRANGRTEPSAADDDYGKMEMARLLFMVEAGDNGFLGLSENQVEKRAEELGIPFPYVAGALWRAQRPWPGSRVAA